MGTLRLLADVFASPARGLAAAAERRSIVPPILLATLASLLVSAVLLPRMDWEAVARKSMDKNPAAAQLSQHEQEEGVATIRKIGTVTSYAGAVVSPALVAVVGAFFLWVGLRTAGARPPFVPSLAVTAWSFLPGAAGRLLLIPAYLGHPSIDPQAVGAIPAWSAAHWLPDGVGAAGLALASSLNLFTLWSAVLLAIGLAPVAQVSRARAGAVVGILWALTTAAGMAAASATG
jgi:hypothetical protein